MQGGRHPHPTPSCARSGSSSSSSDGVKGDSFPGSRFPGNMEPHRGGDDGGGGGGGPPQQQQQQQHPKLLERASLPADFLWSQQHQSQLLSANRGHLPVSRTVSDSSARNARMAAGLGGHLGDMGGGGSGGGGRGSVGVIGGSRAALMSSRRKLESEVSLKTAYLHPILSLLAHYATS